MLCIIILPLFCCLFLSFLHLSTFFARIMMYDDKDVSDNFAQWRASEMKRIETRAHATMNAHPWTAFRFRARNEKWRNAWSSVVHVESYSQPKSIRVRIRAEFNSMHCDWLPLQPPVSCKRAKIARKFRFSKYRVFDIFVIHSLPDLVSIFSFRSNGVQSWEM